MPRCRALGIVKLIELDEQRLPDYVLRNLQRMKARMPLRTNFSQPPTRPVEMRQHELVEAIVLNETIRLVEIRLEKQRSNYGENIH